MYRTMDELCERIRKLEHPYHQRAYLFVVAGLEYCQQNRTARGHISGDELARGCRDLAVEQFGLTARPALAHWGIERTEDFGRIVFQLIEMGLLMKQESDTEADFDRVYDFEEAFDGAYPWRSVKLAGNNF